MSRSKITSDFRPPQESLTVRLPILRDILWRMEAQDDQESTAEHHMNTRSSGIVETSTTSKSLLSKSKYILQDLSRKCPAYHDYHDSLKIPAGAEPFDVVNGAPEIHQGEVFCRDEKADGTLCGHRACRTNDLERHLVAKHGYDLAALRRNRKKKPSLKKTRKFYNDTMKEAEMETQETELALPGQKRKRAESVSSEDYHNEDEDDEEDFANAFKAVGYPMSGAIPNDEVINDVADDEDDFVRSRAPSPSSISAEDYSRVDSVAAAAPKKRGAFFSRYNRNKTASRVHALLGSGLNQS